MEEKCLFKPRFASFVIEATEELNVDKLEYLGNTISEKEIIISENEKLDLEELIKIWQEPLEKVFPTKKEAKSTKIENVLSDKKQILVAKSKIAKPKVFIPVFPGTNCEYDLAKAFIDAGGDPRIEVFKNLKENKS